MDKSRLCYVIMPFSKTESCTTRQWTRIFEDLIKPAVEEAGRGYECRRSEATRGNIIKAIIRSLHEANVVIADVTDQNPNVFYELGVRHALTDGTILLAQKLKSIPFDLRNYAVCVYGWRTRNGQQAFRRRLKQLLADVDREPERPDNPVSDFLAGQNRARAPRDPQAREASTRRPRVPQEQRIAIDATNLAASIRKKQDLPGVREYVREKRRLLQSEWPRRIVGLSSTQPDSRQLAKDEIYGYAVPLISQFDKDVPEIESLGLSAVESEWEEGLKTFFALPCDWITLSEKRISSYRAIQSAPGLCAFRFMSVLTARAVNNNCFDIVGLLLREPLETKEASDQADMRSLVERKRLFYPEGLLGRADLGVRYLLELWDRSEHLTRFFASKEEYWEGLAKYYLLSCLGGLVAAPRHSPLFPGYAMIPGHTAALNFILGRMHRDPRLVSSIAQTLGETPDAFRSAWPERAAALNADSRKVDWGSDFSLPEKL